jgi:uncharacterized protein YjbI with pentapeptide repeats
LDIKLEQRKEMKIFLLIQAFSHRISRQFSQIRTEARWGDTGILAAASAVIGLAADLLQSRLHLLSWFFPGSICLLCFGYVGWRLCSRRWETTHVGKLRKITAQITIYGWVGTLVFGSIFAVNATLGGEKGAVATLVPGAAELQQYIAQRLDRIELALQILTQGTERQGKTMEAVRATMDLSVALDLIDRARISRDGSNQGQTAALESLVTRGYSYSSSNFSGISFDFANIPGVDFSNAILHFLSIKGANLRNANLSVADLRFTNAVDADFTGANLSEARAPFFYGQGAHFQGAKMERANFHGADLRGADLRGAKLAGSAFAFADLRGADLRGADLSGAYFIGALLEGARLDEAVFQQTNMLAAVLNPAAVSEKQRSEACRHPLQGHDRIKIDLTERWPSAKNASGYEYQVLTAYKEEFPFVSHTAFEDLSLPICTTSAEVARAFNANYPLREGLLLDREYLEKANRRKNTLTQLKELAARLNQAYKQGPFFVGSGDYRVRWLNTMKDAGGNIAPISEPYINTDQLLVQLLSEGLIQEQEVKWKEMAQARLRFENVIDSEKNGEFERYTAWPRFFPKDAPFDDLPKEATDLYRQWTLNRRSEVGRSLILQPASRLIRNKSQGEYILSLRTGFIRETAEERVYSWPNWSTDRVKAMLGDLDKTQFAAVWLVPAGVERVILAFPVIYNSYLLDISADIATKIEEINPDLEIMLRIDRIQRVPGYESIIVIFVTPEQAHVRLSGNIIQTGKLRQTAIGELINNSP